MNNSHLKKNQNEWRKSLRESIEELQALMAEEATKYNDLRIKFEAAVK